MKGVSKKIVIFAIIIVAVIALIFGYSRLTSSSPGKYDNFTKCLTEKNVTMYGSLECSHCQNQKKMFGSSIKYVNYVECGPLSGPINNECINAGVRAFPTWSIDGKLYEGEKSIQELGSLTGCSVN